MNGKIIEVTTKFSAYYDELPKEIKYRIGHNSCTSGTGHGALCHEGRVLLATALAFMPKISDAYLCPI